MIVYITLREGGRWHEIDAEPHDILRCYSSGTLRYFAPDGSGPFEARPCAVKSNNLAFDLKLAHHKMASLPWRIA